MCAIPEGASIRVCLVVAAVAHLSLQLDYGEDFDQMPG